METFAGKVVIVDDEPVLMRAICDTLRDHGYETIGFTSGHEALEAIRTIKFDLLLSDLNMPEKDGITLMQEATALDNNLVVIIITGQASIDSAVEAMKKGALDYILKPFKLKAILPVLSRAMAVRQLRMKNAELTEHLKNHTLELEAINKDLDAFSASISHDLRVPLNFIKNFTEMLRQEPGTSPGKANKLLAQIDRNVENMEELIDSLLQFARSGRRAVNKAHVDMTRTVQLVLDQVLPDPSRCKIEVASLPEGYCDEKLIFQVFMNLISNSVKYSGKKDNPLIQIGANTHPDELIFYVKDNGDGFDNERAALLFEPFQRLHTENEFEGTGVGLAIVKRIVTKHGGRVWAESQKGMGATFYFSLPVN